MAGIAFNLIIIHVDRAVAVGATFAESAMVSINTRVLGQLSPDAESGVSEMSIAQLEGGA